MVNQALSMVQRTGAIVAVSGIRLQLRRSSHTHDLSGACFLSANRRPPRIKSGAAVQAACDRARSRHASGEASLQGRQA
jgi:hypothetical protein